jgi:hypothetical protein
VLSVIEKMGIDPPQEPFSNVADILNDALSDLLEQPPSPPDPPSSMCSWEDILSLGLTQTSRDCYDEFFREAAEWAKYMGELILWTFETLLDLLDLILALLLSLPINVLLALLYGMQLLLYGVYQNIRTLLAEFGFVYPLPDELSTSIGQSLTSTFLACGVPFKYPVSRNNNVSHLVCPTGGIEAKQTAPDFYSLSSPVEATDFIESLPFDRSALTSYAAATDPAQTIGLEREEPPKRIGNATELTKWMITAAVEESPEDEPYLYANWDLDSDRGYGYKAWSGRLEPSENEIVEEKYVD